jgi:DNA polymerase I
MLEQFREVWAVDFEYYPDANLHPTPVCLCARECRTGRLIRLWRDEFGARPPYSTSADALFVCYHASAEVGCHLALGWPGPERILDLEAEFRCSTTGYQVEGGKGLLGALGACGLDTIGKGEKKHMQDLVLTGGPFTAAERAQILDYCQTDVDALREVLPRMLPEILDRPEGWRLAMIRGAYSGDVAHMERRGIRAMVNVGVRAQAAACSSVS